MINLTSCARICSSGPLFCTEAMGRIPVTLKPGFHYTANSTTTTQQQSDYEAEQSSFTIIATLDPGGLFKLKLSKNDQSIMVFLSNYDRSNFLSYFPFSDLISDCVWIERRKG